MSLTKSQALEMFNSDDLIGIGMEADAVRRKLHPEGVVTYIIDRNINYTNFCTEYCTFCAFYRPLKGPAAKEGYILDFDTIYEKIRETVELGGTGVLMQGGLHPDLKIDWHEKMLSGIKQRFPKVHLHCYSASEIIAIAQYSSLSIRDTILRLRDAGLDSIPGGGAEILDDEVRYKIARLKCLTDDWINVHRTAHQIGMRTTATMMFGVGENYENRVNHFQEIYNLQEETGGFTAFIPWSFQPHNTALGGRHWDEATAVEYLKVLAISRLYLTNILNVQSSWVTQGLKVCQMGLRFGGNDVGSVMLEENVVRAAGVTNCTTEEELRRIIRAAGYVVPAVFPKLMLKHSLALVIFAFSALLVTSAQQSSPTASVSSIAGTVVQEPGSQPLKKVLVQIVAENQKEGGNYTAPTDADGHFHVDNVLPGRYRLFLERTGFVGVNERGLKSDINVFTIQTGQSIEDLLLRMLPTAVITGRVTDEDGDPMSGVRVVALKKVPGKSKWQEASGTEATNDLGEYRLAGLFPGQYWIAAMPPPDFRDYEEAHQASPTGADQGASRGASQPETRYLTTYYPGAYDAMQAS